MEVSFNHKSLHLLLDSNGNLCHSNTIDESLSSKILDKPGIWQTIKEKKNGTQISGEYYIEFEEIKIGTEQLYLLIMKELNLESEKYCLEYLAYKDYFTGLYNRNLWEHIVEGSYIIPDMQYFTLALIDIDDLKVINDTVGHTKGDRVIKIVADVIKRHVRKGDMAIRYGGDEFIILFPNISSDDADEMLCKIKKDLVSGSFKEDIKIQVSIGSAVGSSVTKISEVMQSADAEMYTEKAEKKR